MTQADAERLTRERNELARALESIRVYASDTLSGRADGPDDRAWQREGVVEIRNRARAALAALESAS